MGIDTIEKIKQLPLDKQKEVDDFVDFLITKYRFDKSEVETIGEKRASLFGRYSNEITMADDFNETPEDFKEYE